MLEMGYWMESSYGEKLQSDKSKVVNVAVNGELAPIKKCSAYAGVSKETREKESLLIERK